MKCIQRSAVLVTMAVVIFTAFVAPAFAEEPTKILPEPTLAKPILGKGKASKLVFETVSGSRFECEKATIEGKFTTPNKGEGKAVVVGCEVIKPIKAKCTNVTLEDQALYWLGLSATKTLTAVVAALITHTLKFECTALVKVEKRGCTAGAVPASELNTKLKVLTGTLKQSKGKQEITEILPPESKADILCVSEISINGGAFEQIGQEGEGTLEVEKEIELMN